MSSHKPSPEQSIRDIQHFGEEGGVVPVIDVASTSTFLDPKDMERTFQGELQGCYLYSRHSNPTVNIFGKKIAAMEGAEAALGVASGMAAIACTIDQILRNEGEKPGHIIASRTVYGGTYALFKNILPPRGITLTFVEITDLKAVEAAITPSTKIIYAETLSNPLLSVSDLRSLSTLCKKRGIKLVIDNTFAPLMVQPLLHGADVVVHSCTKFISGSSDFIAGAIAGSADFIASLIDVNHGSVMLTGPVMDPRVAHELYLRLDHLPVRMQAHSRMASFLATRMEKEGMRVIYPGLEAHPQHNLLKSIMNPEFGYGGILTLECDNVEKALQLATRLQDEKFGLYAVSLGFSRTLMSCPAKSTSSEIPEEEQKLIGLNPGLLRFSIGYIGSAEQMWERFLRAYRAIA
ncbi:MAG TPA: aminotransferase class I/II-fold pyridoxal phosphate-dependent enzyme [Bacteriovoracaceae bacterium]|nr:aminotransferase class I/II-fold pyridoxal phosphate-dependent enzyme [Bacteriovoracaceae bacterium]